MAKKIEIEASEVVQNLKTVKEVISKNGLDAFYVSSFDPYLNEYVPLLNCHRFYVTGFTGSVAEVLVLKEGKARLYVDGRYYEQADLEVNANEVDVIKVPGNLSLSQALLNDVELLKLKKVGVEGERTSLSFYKALSLKAEVKTFGDVLGKEFNNTYHPIYKEDLKFVGRSVEEKIKEVVKNTTEGYFVTALDSLSWMTNLRGYHLPNASAFVGRGLVTNTGVHVFIEPSITVEESAKKSPFLFFHKTTESNFKDLLKEISLSKVYYDSSSINVSNFEALKEVFGEKALSDQPGLLISYHSIKTNEELNTIRASFNKGDTAIYNTIKWAKDKVKFSELELYNKTNESYEKEGSREQSFNTISGIGANGSIIHYGDPKDNVYADKDSMVLLDSGGYFYGGFATDTTRTFLASHDGKASDMHKKVYTLVLKALLGLQNAIFPEGTKGIELDAITRRPIWQEGFNYNHGTGHGVGINVHEGGVRISPLSNLPMKENQVVSLEPGIYIPRFGGVRLENIAIVKKHPKYEGMLHFENLVYIGFDPLLINFDMLTFEEKTWLDEYEKECKNRGRSFYV